MTGRGLHELLAVVALALGSAGCSGAVNALYRADAAADVAAASVDAQAETGGGVAVPIQVCPSLPGAPAGVGPLPSALQIAYQRTELTGLPDGRENVTEAPVQPATVIAPSNSHFLDKIPQDVLRLLWFRDGPNKNEAMMGDGQAFQTRGSSIRISYLGAIEPSSIGLGDLVQEPSDLGLVERPSYYTSYEKLTPEQRWVYLDWLGNVDKEIDIGYVFIFYYGLERHLFFEAGLYARGHVPPKGGRSATGRRQAW